MPVQFAPQEEDNSAAGQIGRLITGTRDQYMKQQDKQKEDVMNQVKLYGQLREAGFSAEDATARVNRTYRSTGFLEKMLTGNQGSNPFNPGSVNDKWGMEQQKFGMEKEKHALDMRTGEATIKEKEATAGYKNRMMTGEHANEKALYDENGDIIAWVPKTSAAAPKKADENSFEAMLGGDQGTPKGNQSDKPSVPMTRPNGTLALVAPKSVSAALAKGYKHGHKK
jgi:hypothetical protein